MKPVTPSKYGWENMLDGEWHLVFQGDPNTFGQQAHNQRLRGAAYKWGLTNGYRVRSKSLENGSRFYVQFAQGLSPWKRGAVEPS